MDVHNPTKIAEEDLSFLPVTSCYQSVLRANTTGKSRGELPRFILSPAAA